jgi:hypothetical protein
VAVSIDPLIEARGAGRTGVASDLVWCFTLSLPAPLILPVGRFKISTVSVACSIGNVPDAQGAYGLVITLLAPSPQ